MRLEQSSECKLKGKFSHLINFAIGIFEKRGERYFKDFKTYIITFFSLDSNILVANSYRQVFDQVGSENKWDYLPLLEILEHFIGQETEDRRTDYQHAVTAYHATEKLTETMSRSNQTRMHHETAEVDVTAHEIQMKLHPHKVSERSLSYIRAVWDSMSHFLSIPSVKTVIDRMHMPPLDTEADYLCAKLPSETSESLMEQGEQSWKNFMKTNNIMKISLCDGRVYSL